MCNLNFRFSLYLVLVFILLSPGFVSAVSAAVQPSPPDPRFGIVESYVNSAAADEAGAGYTRVILRWDVIQPGSRDDWKPANVPDPFIASELAAGRQVVGLLIGTPAWAAVDPGQGARSVPDMDKWRAFAQRMAQQYRGRIHDWVIWNEPDVWDLDHPGNTWAGSVEDYYRLLKTAYQAIKDVDPEMRVTVAGLTYFWDHEHGKQPFLDRLLEVAAADPEAPAHGYYFDAVVYHLYFKPLQTVEVLAWVQDTLAKHGISGKEVWVNETNAPPSDDPQELPWSAPRFRISLQEQAAFVIQEFSLAFASGANRVEFYKLRNTPDHPESIEPFGLLRGDDSPRPAFTAYQVATSYLRDFQSVWAERQGDIYAVTFARGAQTTTVLWTLGRAATRVQIHAIAEEAILVDEAGNQRSLKASGGVYTVDLPSATCTAGDCFIGGAPRLLVEDGPAGGREALLSIGSPVAAPAASPRPGAVAPEVPGVRDTCPGDRRCPI